MAIAISSETGASCRYGSRHKRLAEAFPQPTPAGYARPAMGRNRLEAFSDGVMAVLITIMVLELKVPHGADWEALRPLGPVFMSYVLSYVYLGIYWNNHHHLLHMVDRVHGSILWGNLHLLFWLSLIPFATGWMGENEAAPLPMAAYGAILFMSGVSYEILQATIVRAQGKNSKLAAAVGRDLKGKLSALLYAVGMVLAFAQPWAAFAIYALVAGIWLVPDRRIESRVNPHEH